MLYITVIPLLPVDRALSALGEQLGDLRFELVVIGGAALQATGLVSRGTRDVDVVALRQGNTLVDPEPLPTELRSAAARVARDLGLPQDWLNTGPSALLRLGLPEGFESRLEQRAYPPGLLVHLAGRLDQIHLKLYAMVDQGTGRHEMDLRSMEPTPDELMRAARWTRTHDPSPAFESELHAVLGYLLGVDDVDLGE